MTPGTSLLTIEQIEENLSNDVYRAALWFERAENAGLIYGNGHHLAQELAQVAVSMLKDRRTHNPKEETR